MSEEVREVIEYARLYAQKHHITIEQAFNTAMVEEFIKWRKKHGKVVSSGSGGNNLDIGDKINV